MQEEVWPKCHRCLACAFVRERLSSDQVPIPCSSARRMDLNCSYSHGKRGGSARVSHTAEMGTKSPFCSLEDLNALEKHRSPPICAKEGPFWDSTQKQHCHCGITEVLGGILGGFPAWGLVQQPLCALKLDPAGCYYPAGRIALKSTRTWQ